LEVVVYVYKNLFRKEGRGNFSLTSNFWEPCDLVSAEESKTLENPFSEEEIKLAIFSCYLEGSPGHDGLSFLFFQKFWDTIKVDSIDLFSDFHRGNLDLFRLNFAMLTLIPKVENAVDMKNFRPISLLNCSFEIFGKLITCRLEKICQEITAKEQSAFIRGRYILESVLVAHQLVHSIHKSKEPGVIIKLDYEKAYDRVNLDFLMEILKARGFGDRMMGWIRSIVFGGSTSVLANGEESPTFTTGKGLR
jgi:hypothetical protein